MYKQVDMYYDQECGRWSVRKGKYEYDLHCGEMFELYIGKRKTMPCRLEWDEGWYVVMENASLALRPHTNYVVNIV